MPCHKAAPCRERSRMGGACFSVAEDARGVWRCACGADAQGRRAGATRKADVRGSREKDIRGRSHVRCLARRDAKRNRVKNERKRRCCPTCAKGAPHKRPDADGARKRASSKTSCMRSSLKADAHGILVGYVGKCSTPRFHLKHGRLARRPEDCHVFLCCSKP